MKKSTQIALEKAVDILGGQTDLAKAVNEHLPEDEKITQRNVWWWLNRSLKASSHCAIPIEIATNNAVNRHELRPDVFGPKPTTA
ncbi:MAG: YdaS family helix-turn-helix protein [Arenicella sp.]